MKEFDFTINFPSVYMHSCPDILSEVSDELLYGTKLKKLGEFGNYVRCETSYGYSGYVHKRYLCKNVDPSGAKEYIVSSNFADLLTAPSYKYRPIMTLSKGSIVYSKSVFSRSEKFFCVLHKGHLCYIPRFSVSPFETNQKTTKTDLNEFRKKLCDDALMYLGTPYRWGGKSSSGIDCSGLCFMSYYMNCLPLWRDSHADTRFVHEIPKEEAKQGDLIYFKGHMAIYIGDGEYVHSAASAGLVTVNSLRKNSVIFRKDLYDSFICFARSNFL